MPLVLTRRPGETIVIAEGITITVVEVKTSNQVKIAIEAPQEVRVRRGEIPWKEK